MYTYTNIHTYIHSFILTYIHIHTYIHTCGKEYGEYTKEVIVLTFIPCEVRTRILS